MYRQLLALVLFLALIVWVYVTILINRSYSSIEAFKNIDRPVKEINYIQKLTDDINGMSSYLKTPKNNNNNSIAPVINTLLPFQKSVIIFFFSKFNIMHNH